MMALPAIVVGAAAAVKTYQVFRKTPLGKTLEGSVIAAAGAITERLDERDGTDPENSRRVKRKGIREAGEGIVGLGIEAYQNRRKRGSQ